jgi:integrase
MRQAEILDIRLGQIQMDGKTTIIKRPDSKNGHPRKVTASNTVETALQTLIDNLPEDVGPDTKLISLNQDKLAWRWKQARKKAGVKDLTWHDLRHEALSILANSGANIGMLQTQSGHRSAKTLIKYINPTPREIKKILDGISES